MKKRIKQFGGDNRVFLEDNELNNIADDSFNRLTDDAQEVVDIIKEGFKDLTEMQRRVISIMCEVDPASAEGRTYTMARAAENLGIPLNTFSGHLDRAKKKLRKLVTKNAGSSIYIESMLRENENDKAETE